MKKVILALVTCSVLSIASETTIDATMKLMQQGMNQIQAGFLYSNRDDVSNGIKVVQDANSIFTKVDVSTFIPKNKKTQVTKNINKNLTKNLIILQKAVEAKNMTDATIAYGKVTANCISCHRIVRGW